MTGEKIFIVTRNNLGEKKKRINVINNFKHESKYIKEENIRVLQRKIPKNNNNQKNLSKKKKKKKTNSQ